MTKHSPAPALWLAACAALALASVAALNPPNRMVQDLDLPTQVQTR